MCWRIFPGLVAGVVIFLVCPIASTAYGEDRTPAWNQKATRQYLEGRVGWWLDWEPAARGQGSTCVSCHTTVPYALALPALSKLTGGEPVPDVARRMLDGVRTHVEKWDDLAAAGPKPEGALAPIFGGGRREPALDTESVLNATVLVAAEPPAKGKLSDAACKALDVMWARQQADGSWRWLEFGLRPWEADGEYFGATLAAVAAGTAGSRYPRHDATETNLKSAALRKFLRARLAEKPLLHNRALALWAASHRKDLFTDDEKKIMVADLFNLQGADGGWSMRDLGKTATAAGAAGWAIVGSHPNGAVSDGYATGLVVLALERAGVPGRDPRLAKGLKWLTTRQAADGTWPVVYVNKKRDPEDDIGKFNRDAGAAFALLALAQAK
jgi:squalene-hopene/tetraprenyl-beta-curcumene cyclase